VIELIPSWRDDIGFLSLVQRIVNGAIISLHAHEVYLVQVHNWFDWKWLGWGSRRGQELSIPPFVPNRVHSEKHFIWDTERLQWTSSDLPKPLHIRQPGRLGSAQPMGRFSSSAAFIWFSGNSALIKDGSLMFYLSGAENYAWYASFRKNTRWMVQGVRQITRKELLAFEDCGRPVVTDQGGASLGQGTSNRAKSEA
jgi:hypothetical protein